VKLEVKIPSVGESVTEATISSWNKKTGDFVKANELLLLIETDKASVEVVAEKDGLLTITTEAGSTIPIGTVVGQIDTSASAGASSAASTASTSSIGAAAAGVSTGSMANAPSPVATKPAAGMSAGAPATTTGGALSFDTHSHLSPAVQKIVTEKS